MKKLIAWILTLCMVMGLLCGCSDTDSSSSRRSSRKDRDEDEETVEDRDDEDRDDDDLVIVDREDEDDKKDTAKVELEEQVVYDDNDIKVTVTGLTEGYSGMEVKIRVENNTENNIVLSGDVFIVNGICMNGWLYTEVAAGKKANDSITFYFDYLEVAGIEAIATVSCVDAHIVDTDSFDTLFETPFAFETSIADDYVQKIDDSGEVLFQDAGVTVIYKTMAQNSMGEQVILLVKNETGKNITVEMDDVSVNGYTVSAWSYDSLPADTVCFTVLDIYSSTLEENEIEKVEEVCFYVEVLDADNWDEICTSDELTVTAD